MPERLAYWRDGPFPRQTRAAGPVNDWVEYVDATTGELLEVHRFLNTRQPTTARRWIEPLGGWDAGTEVS